MNEEEQRVRNAKLIQLAETKARDVLHYMAQEQPDKYAELETLITTHHETFRGFIRTLFITAFQMGEDNVKAALAAEMQHDNEHNPKLN